MITKPEPKPVPDITKPIYADEPWAQAVYPKGHVPEHPGTFEEWEKAQIAYGRKDSDTPAPPPKPPEPPPPPPPPPPEEDPNWANMNWEQRLDAILGGWAREDGTIDYDSPLCPFKRPPAH